MKLNSGKTGEDEQGAAYRTAEDSPKSSPDSRVFEPSDLSGNPSTKEPLPDESPKAEYRRRRREEADLNKKRILYVILILLGTGVIVWKMIADSRLVVVFPFVTVFTIANLVGALMFVKEIVKSVQEIKELDQNDLASLSPEEAAEETFKECKGLFPIFASADHLTKEEPTPDRLTVTGHILDFFGLNRDKPVPYRLTRAEFRYLRRQEIWTIVGAAFLFALMFSVAWIIFGMGWSSVLFLKEEIWISVFMIVIAVVMAILVPIFTFKIIKKSLEQIKELKKSYFFSLPFEKRATVNENRKKHGWILPVFVLIVILAAVWAPGIVQNIKRENIYTSAQKMISEREYADAVSKLSLIEPKNRQENERHETLMAFCSAHIDYDGGQFLFAHDDMTNIDSRYLTAAQKAEATVLQKKVGKAYDAYLKKQEQEKKEEEQKEKIWNGVPYPGMPESEIGNTSLGPPESNVTHHLLLCPDGKYRKSNVYVFQEWGRTIFTAECVLKQVEKVSDKRDDPASSETGSIVSSTESGKSSDPYDAKRLQRR